MDDRNVPQPRWDLEAATYLVEAVRDAGGKIPSRFETPLDESDPNQMNQWRTAMSELAESASYAFTWCDAWRVLTTPEWWSARLQALSKIKGQLQRANKVLSKDPAIAREIDAHLRVDFPRVEDAVPEIIKAVQVTEELMAPQKGQTRKTPPLPEVATTPEEVATTPEGVALKTLADTYREFFEAEPTNNIQKTYGNYDGPFVAFVRGAFKIADKPKSDSALTKAVQRTFEVGSRGQ